MTPLFVLDVTETVIQHLHPENKISAGWQFSMKDILIELYSTVCLRSTQPEPDAL